MARKFSRLIYFAFCKKHYNPFCKTLQCLFPAKVFSAKEGKVRRTFLRFRLAFIFVFR